MSMVIGTNVASLTAQRHLESSRADLNTSMERLSSGSRINSAQDDAAGLAISDRMDSQVNGLSQAVRNANDAISLGQTAEGSLEETTAILQRMRDLSVQSGNATNTTADRTAMQTEVASLQAELTRISDSSTFNGQSLLDGTFSAGSFQIGHNASDTVSLSISAMGAADLNKVTAVTAVTAVTGVTAVTAVTAVSEVAATATLTFSSAAAVGDNTTATVGSATLSHDFASAATTTQAADAYVAAWNASTDTDVAAYTASASSGTVTFTQDTGATGALSASVVNSAAGAALRSTISAGDTGVVAVDAVPATGTIQITADPAASDGTDFLTATVGDAVFTYNADSDDVAGDADTFAASFVVAWNAETGDSEVSKYTASASTDTITFTEKTATAGAMVISEVVGAGGMAATAAAVTTGVEVVAAVAATATQTFTAAAAANEVVEITVGDAVFAYDFGASDLADATATAAAVVSAWNSSGDANVAAYTASNAAGVVTYTQDTVSAGALTVAKVDGAASGVASTTASVVTGVTGVDAVTGVTGVTAVAAVTGVTAVTGSSVNTLDISTADGATAAITSLDLAIAEVAAERATLGAFQNRLEHTVSNLSSMIENTSAARSRIQDADFAVESANLAKNQVMQQAGTAMLAQANASGQGVLSLLK